MWCWYLVFQLKHWFGSVWCKDSGSFAFKPKGISELDEIKVQMNHQLWCDANKLLFINWITEQQMPVNTDKPLVKNVKRAYTHVLDMLTADCIDLQMLHFSGYECS